MRMQRELEEKRLWKRMLEADDQESAQLFIFGFAKTKDPFCPQEPIRGFPTIQYLREAIALWVRYRLTLWAKSRRLLFTWLFVGLNLWDAIKYPARYQFFQSRKMEDAGLAVEYALLWRAIFMLDQLPGHLGYSHNYVLNRRDHILTLGGNGSILRGVSADFDAFRQFGTTSILADEVAMQQNPALSFTAGLPAVESFGRYTGLSTVNAENFFWLKVIDEE